MLTPIKSSHVDPIYLQKKGWRTKILTARVFARNLKKETSLDFNYVKPCLDLVKLASRQRAC